MFQLLLSDKYVSVSEWQGTTRIHIRTYFSSNGDAPGSGELIPTKKGIALTIDEWNALKNYIDIVDAEIAHCEDQRILGKGMNHAPYVPPLNAPPSLIPEECQAKPSFTVSRPPPLKIRRVTPQARCELEPFDQ